MDTDILLTRRAPADQELFHLRVPLRVLLCHYVTKEAVETHMARYEPRGLRKSSHFGGHAPDENDLRRHIHGEQMSFFPAGTGRDTYYCYQLGKRYFKYVRSAEERVCVYSQGWTPSTLFLSWMAMVLHHVGTRWHDAIPAVDDLIASEEAVVFHQMDNFGTFSHTQI